MSQVTQLSQVAPAGVLLAKMEVKSVIVRTNSSLSY